MTYVSQKCQYFTYIRLEFQKHGFCELSELFQNIFIQVYSKKVQFMNEIRKKCFHLIWLSVCEWEVKQEGKEQL